MTKIILIKTILISLIIINLIINLILFSLITKQNLQIQEIQGTEEVSTIETIEEITEETIEEVGDVEPTTYDFIPGESECPDEDMIIIEGVCTSVNLEGQPVDENGEVITKN